MISEEEAKSIVLRFGADSEQGLRLGIMSCELSSRGDYWIVRANGEDFVRHGDWNAMLVGVSGYLVNANSGGVTVVGSAGSLEDALQDKSDEDAAGSRHYVLQPAFDRFDKAALMNLRRRLECSLQTAIGLLSPHHCHWLTGSRRLLLSAEAMLLGNGIETEIVLRAEPGSAVEIDDDALHWDALAARIRSLVQAQ